MREQQAAHDISLCTVTMKMFIMEDPFESDLFF